jgi:hypothetical protein
VPLQAAFEKALIARLDDAQHNVVRDREKRGGGKREKQMRVVDAYCLRIERDAGSGGGGWGVGVVFTHTLQHVN